MLKKTSLLTAFIAVAATTFAQSDAISKKYAQEINVESATKHLTILASDEFEGRDTGKPGGHKAAEYIANEFKKMGLDAPVNGSYFQPVDLIETSLSVSEFTINNKPYQVGEGFYMTATGKQSIAADEIVFIGYGISEENYNDLDKIDIENKVVLLINEGEPVNADGTYHISGSKESSAWSTQRNKRIQSVAAHNPKLIIAASSQVDSFLERFGDRLNRPRLMLREDYKKTPNSPAVAHVNFSLANELLKGKKIEDLQATINKSGKPQSAVIKSTFKTNYAIETTDVKSDNVLGYLEGSDLKDELVVISAHYDHVGIQNGEIYNGADDDGSGTTGVIEVSRAFVKSKEEGHGPRRSILFLLVTAEEKGLMGSDYYTRNPIFPLENTVTDLNIDMIGRVDPPHEENPNYIYLIGSDKLSSELHAISEKANQQFTKLDLDYKYNDPNDPERIYYRSDHYNFAKHGIPVIFYFNGVHADYHKPSDTVDKINFELLVKRAKLVFHTAWEVANRDKKLVVDSNKK